MSVRSFVGLGLLPSGQESKCHLLSKNNQAVGTVINRILQPHSDRCQHHTTPRPNHRRNPLILYRAKCNVSMNIINRDQVHTHSQSVNLSLEFQKRLTSMTQSLEKRLKTVKSSTNRRKSIHSANTLHQRKPVDCFHNCRLLIVVLVFLPLHQIKTRNRKKNKIILQLNASLHRAGIDSKN